MISVVIPVYNEEAAIAPVVSQLSDVLAAADCGPFEIIVVDDGSTDRTAERAQDAGAIVKANVQNMGYGFALKRGIEAARYDEIVILDGDGTYPAEAIPELVRTFRRGFNLVVAARTGPHYRESLLKFPLRIIFKWLVEITVGRKIQDVNSGLRVISRKEIMQFFPYLSDKFSFTTSQTLAYNLSHRYIHYVPIGYEKRVGRSKVRLFRDSLSALQMIVSAILYYNPLKLFLILCGFLFILSTISVSIALYTGAASAYLFSGLSALCVLLVAGIGFVAEVIRQAVGADRARLWNPRTCAPKDAPGAGGHS